jgi:hypothetical protein
VEQRTQLRCDQWRPPSAAAAAALLTSVLLARRRSHADPRFPSVCPSSMLTRCSGGGRPHVRCRNVRARQSTGTDRERKSGGPRHCPWTAWPRAVAASCSPTPPHCTRPRSGTRGMGWRAVVECACTDAICPLLLLLRPCCRHRRPCCLCSARLCCCRCVWVTSSWSERSLS